MDNTVQQLLDVRMALRKNEVWREVDFSDVLTDTLTLPDPNVVAEAKYHCNIPNLEALRLTVVNGYCRQPLTRLANGVVMGGLRDAKAQCPELVEKVLGACVVKPNAYQEVNDKGYTDGVFLYVPDGVALEETVQLQSLVNSEQPLFIQVRNAIYVGRNAKVALVHCDDSHDDNQSFSNNVTEIMMGENAHVQHYKMQNLNDRSGLLNHTYVLMADHSVLRSNNITLNGGSIRNHTEIRMNGEGCDTQAHGLYLIDKEQKADNYVYVEHSHPHCVSQELFKGIMDDAAKAVFNGHVLVCDGAVKTEAYQTNKNIMMTDKATVNTKPFLEIYNDDVKCSHGSTIGQLDEQALFYIRSRGISERTAKTLLLYAFCDEVLQKIEIESLRESLMDLVKKRLHGELTPCSECALHCGAPCNGPEARFAIDPTKL